MQRMLEKYVREMVREMRIIAAVLVVVAVYCYFLDAIVLMAISSFVAGLNAGSATVAAIFHPKQ